MVDLSWTAIGFGSFAALVLGVCAVLYLKADSLERVAKRLLSR